MRRHPLTAVTIAIFFICSAQTPLTRADDVEPVPRFDKPLQRKIVFVSDSSDSMVPKMDQLREELKNAINGLRAIQSYGVIFIRQNIPAKLDDALMMATPDNKKKGCDFVDQFKPGGVTDPLPAMEAAMSLKPVMIYLLCDHDFRDADAFQARIRELNANKKVKINTIAFVGEKDRDTRFQEVLKQIATDNDGVSKYVKVDDLKDK